ncbi:MAG: glycosyltransferase [Verrucomicrobiota bacterium]
MPEPRLLLLIPAYNEEARIGPVLRELGHYFQGNYQGEFQFVVVLNGCRDNTRGVVEAVAKSFPFIRFLDFPDPIGKGGALIEGLKLASEAEIVGYVDADGATPPAAFHALAKRTERSRLYYRVALVAGSGAASGAAVGAPLHQPLLPSRRANVALG